MRKCGDKNLSMSLMLKNYIINMRLTIADCCMMRRAYVVRGADCRIAIDGT